MTGLAKNKRPLSLIDGWLGPEARLLERHELRVAAPPERVAEAVQQVRVKHRPMVHTWSIFLPLRADIM